MVRDEQPPTPELIGGRTGSADEWVSEVSTTVHNLDHQVPAGGPHRHSNGVAPAVVETIGRELVSDQHNLCGTAFIESGIGRPGCHGASELSEEDVSDDPGR